jgi:Sec-independent protein translocase protein TatA
VAGDTPQSSERRTGSEPAADTRESVAEIRAAISQVLDGIVDRLEEAQKAVVLETERRAALIAGERLGEAVGEFRASVREIAAEAERELKDGAPTTQGTGEPGVAVGPGIRTRSWATSLVARVEAAARRSSLAARARREATRATGVADAGAVSGAEERLEAIERRAQEAAARVKKGLARVEQAIDQVEQAQQRALEAEDRVRAMERRVEDVADTAARVAEWEGRMWSAIRVEEEVARRITEAEKRILGTIKESEPAEPSAGRRPTG